MMFDCSKVYQINFLRSFHFVLHYIGKEIKTLEP